MRTSRLLAMALAVVTMSACNPFNRGRAVEMSTDDAMLNSRWHANLASPAELAGAVQMSGSATMAPEGNGTFVRLNLANAAPGGLHPWAVHHGSCGTGNDQGVFGTSDLYSPLEVNSDGHADGSETIKVPTPRSGDYFAVVFASRGNANTIVACGNLAAPTR
jgi:hypothetical protein